MPTVLCARPVTSSTPAAGHAGAITTKNVHGKATASDNNSKITKCGWSTRKQARTGQRTPSRRHDEPFRLTRSMTRLPSLLGFRTFRLAMNCTQFRHGRFAAARRRTQIIRLCAGARGSAHAPDAMHNGSYVIRQENGARGSP